MKPYIVGIAGGSASGKTFVLRRLLDSFKPHELTLVSLDNYYRPIEDQQPNEDGMINWDQPTALDLDKCKRHLSRLIKGRKASVKEWTFNNPLVTPRKIVYRPAPLIVVEGLFVYNNEHLRRLFDLKVFIDAEEHIKLSRRIRRDTVERNIPLDEVLDQYASHVVPMYHLHVEPFKYSCDIILPNNSILGKGVDVIVSHMQAELVVRKDFASNGNDDNGVDEED